MERAPAGGDDETLSTASALAADAALSGGLQQALGCALGSLAPVGADVLVAVAGKPRTSLPATDLRLGCSRC